MVGNSSPHVCNLPANDVYPPLALLPEITVVEESTNLAPKRLKMPNVYGELLKVLQRCELKDYIKKWIIDNVQTEYDLNTQDDTLTKSEKKEQTTGI